MSARRRWSLPLLVGGLALALTGCLKVDMDLQVNADGNVDGTMVVAVSDRVFELGGEEFDRDELYEELASEFDDDELPEGASAETSVYDEDGFYGAKVELRDLPAEELSGAGGQAGDDDDTFTLERDGDTFVFRGTMDFSEDLGAGGEDNPFGASMLEDAEGRVRVQFPGEVLEHNGELDGTTVTWELSFTEPNDMRATSRTEGGASGGGDDDGGSAVGAVIAVLVVAAVVVGIVLFVRSRKGKGDGGPPPAPVMAGAPPPDPGTAGPGPFAPPPPPAPPPTEGTLPPPPPPPA